MPRTLLYALLALLLLSLPATCLAQTEDVTAYTYIGGLSIYKTQSGPGPVSASDNHTFSYNDIDHGAGTFTGNAYGSASTGLPDAPVATLVAHADGNVQYGYGDVVTEVANASDQSFDQALYIVPGPNTPPGPVALTFNAVFDAAVNYSTTDPLGMRDGYSDAISYYVVTVTDPFGQQRRFTQQAVYNLTANGLSITSDPAITITANVGDAITLYGTNSAQTNVDSGYRIAGTASGTADSTSQFYAYSTTPGVILATPGGTIYNPIPNQIPPSAVADSYTTNEDTPLTIAAPGVLANDSPGSGGPLSATLVSGPSHGTLDFHSDGSFTYTPAPLYYGTDQFVYNASNDQGTTADTTVSLTINHVNHPPVAASQSVTLNEDASAAITLTATDVDSDALTYSIVSQPQHGTLTGTAPNLTYTPAPLYYGPDSFTFKANDGQLDSNTATVSITVLHVNHSPVAQNDSAETRDNQPVTIPVLANDTDVDGDTLQVIAVSAPTHGKVVINGGTSVTYTANAYSGGTDSFTYTISDGHGGTATATVTVNVYAVTVTNLVRISQGQIKLNKKTGRYEQTVTLKNTSASAIPNVSYVLDNVTGGQVYILNGITVHMPPVNSPFLGQYSGVTVLLQPKKRMTFQIEFFNSHGNITYTPRVLAGTGSR